MKKKLLALFIFAFIFGISTNTASAETQKQCIQGCYDNQNIDDEHGKKSKLLRRCIEGCLDKADIENQAGIEKQPNIEIKAEDALKSYQNCKNELNIIKAQLDKVVLPNERFELLNLYSQKNQLCNSLYQKYEDLKEAENAAIKPNDAYEAYKSCLEDVDNLKRQLSNKALSLDERIKIINLVGEKHHLCNELFQTYNKKKKEEVLAQQQRDNDHKKAQMKYEKCLQELSELSTQGFNSAPALRLYDDNPTKEKITAKQQECNRLRPPTRAKEVHIEYDH